MKKYNYEQIDEHIQWLINFMKEEYPNDFEIVLDSFHAEIRSKLITLNFLSNELKQPNSEEINENLY